MTLTKIKIQFPVNLRWPIHRRSLRPSKQLRRLSSPSVVWRPENRHRLYTPVALGRRESQSASLRAVNLTYRLNPRVKMKRRGQQQQILGLGSRFRAETGRLNSCESILSSLWTTLASIRATRASGIFLSTYFH